MPDAAGYSPIAAGPANDRPVGIALGPAVRVGLATVILLVVFAIVEHDLMFANNAILSVDEADIRDTYIEQMEHGDLLRKLTLIGFGSLGAALLVASRRKAWNLRWSVLSPLLMLIALATLSTAWSDQPSITAKRLVVLGCIVLGCAGYARWLSAREFLLVALLTLLGFTLGSIAIDLAMGGRPWEGGDYRFGGTLHPNMQATYCGILCLAAVCQPIGFGRRWVLRGVFVYGVALILLTQSRTGLLSLAVALVLVWVLRLTAGMKWAGVAFILASIAFAFVAYNSVGDGDRNRVINAALMGRTEQSSSLTGRVPLWEELGDYAARRPWGGYGYEGFWTTDRIAAILKSQNWTVQNAHNSYFEVLIQLGVVGLALTVWWLFAGVNALTAAYEITREPGYAFAFGVVALGMTNSLAESLFAKVRYSPALALIGLLMVALFFPRDTDAKPSQDAALSAQPSKT